MELRGRTLLIVDDSVTVRAAIKSALEGAGLFDNYTEAKDGNEALRLLGELPWMSSCATSSCPASTGSSSSSG